MSVPALVVVSGLAASGKDVTGVVDRVSMSDGKAILHIGADTVALNNVRDILPSE